MNILPPDILTRLQKKVPMEEFTEPHLTKHRRVGQTTGVYVDPVLDDCLFQMLGERVVSDFWMAYKTEPGGYLDWHVDKSIGGTRTVLVYLDPVVFQSEVLGSTLAKNVVEGEVFCFRHDLSHRSLPHTGTEPRYHLRNDLI